MGVNVELLGAVLKQHLIHDPGVAEAEYFMWVFVWNVLVPWLSSMWLMA